MILEYETLWEEVGRRENSLLIVGSIFVGGSLSLLGGALQSSLPLCPTSMFVVFLNFWYLLFYWTSTRLDKIYYDRISEIEDRKCEMGEKWEFGVNNYVRTKTKCEWWLLLRGCFWYVVFLSLIIYIAWLVCAL